MFNANYILLIENQINLQLQHDFVEYFKSHQMEMLVREKLKWRASLIDLFFDQLTAEEVTQFEVDQLAWKVFSKIDSEQAKAMLADDIDFFKRSMSVASSYTLCAFLLGYYNDEFLTELYNETFLNLIDLKSSLPKNAMKTQLEILRTQKSLMVEDKKILDEIYKLGSNRNVLIGERYDGSGLLEINKSEMTDLEIVFVALSEHYSFSNSSYNSIFKDIKNSNFKCDEKILGVLKKGIKVKEKISHVKSA